MDPQKKLKRAQLFSQLDAAEQIIAGGTAAGGSVEDATEALISARAMLESDFVITDIKSANRELDFCESALGTCSDGVGGIVSVKDILNAFDHDYAAYLKKDDAANNLKTYCLSFSKYFRSCPSCMFLKVSIESYFAKTNAAAASQKADKTQVERLKSKRKSRVEALAAEETDEINGELDTVDENDERDQEIIREITRITTAIKKELRENSDNPIDYWHFVYDPTSKGKTFMNILHVNHVLQNHDICLVEGDVPGALFLCMTKFFETHCSTSTINLQSFSVQLTDDKYEELQQRYGS